MDFKKAIDFLTPQGLKDVINNLQNRIKELMNDNSKLLVDVEGLKKKNEELENRIRLLLSEKPKPQFESNPKNKDRTSDREEKRRKKAKAPKKSKSSGISLKGKSSGFFVGFAEIYEILLFKN